MHGAACTRMKNHRRRRRCRWSTTLFPDPVKLCTACTRRIFGELVKCIHIRIACTCNQCRWQTIADSRFMLYSDGDAATAGAAAAAAPSSSIFSRKFNLHFPPYKRSMQYEWGWAGDMLNTSFRYRRMYAVGERHDTLLDWHTFFLFIRRRVHRTGARLAWSSSTHVHRSIRWRFYCAYNSIGNLWWCDVDNDNDGDDDEFILMLATAEAACDYCRQTTAMRTKLTNIVTTAYYTYSLARSLTFSCPDSGIPCAISWENIRKCSRQSDANWI